MSKFQFRLVIYDIDDNMIISEIQEVIADGRYHWSKRIK